ncbi:unnamed protein product [Euphydryas editha]|uniref:Uncharacterized protein n=1 Tax=Euphydryas editha TaxID=104508 RepID=A0AAU9UWR1_EUPED|nr:unnamed protein product [Euphydryas editha]
MDCDNTGLLTTSGTRVVTRQFIFDQLQSQNLPTLNEKLDYYENFLLMRYGHNKETKEDLKKRFSYVKSQIKQRWAKANKHQNVFLKTNQSWLEGTFEIPIESASPQGRPPKSFGELSERSKRRKTEEIRASVGDEVIVHAATSVLQTTGHRTASKMLKDITNSPTRASKYRKAYSRVTANDKVPPLTPLQALKMFVEADLTRRQYEIIRATNPQHFPCYDLILKAKQECYPPKESLRITATCAESNLQCLMDLTVTRLSKYLEDVIIRLNEQERKSLMIICKWGCDGSQQSKYKQSYDNETDSDANIFMSSFVPLRIVCGKEGSKIVWQNPTPSSSRFCRPIRFRFVKETTDITKEEIKYVQESIKQLKKTVVMLNEEEFSFGHQLKMSMIDGKVCNAATDTKSTSQCYICGATSKTFNDLSKKNIVNPQALEFGLSVLHARIRIFESIIHLSYKLPVKKYRKRRTEEDKALEAQKKLEIQERFRNETGLLIDMPKANFGNSNDGNTSRRFFENPELASDITGINFELIYRFKVILETISSGHKIDAEKYDKYAYDTAKLYVEQYGWHPMTPTMHKILVHGSQIIKSSLLPIGQLSEEAAEARNKHFRSYRLNFARKFSREECNLDVYYRLLLSSDPFISCLRQIRKPSRNAFLPETVKLLLPADPNTESVETSEPEDTDF